MTHSTPALRPWQLTDTVDVRAGMKRSSFGFRAGRQEELATLRAIYGDAMAVETANRSRTVVLRMTGHCSPSPCGHASCSWRHASWAIVRSC